MSKYTIVGRNFFVEDGFKPAKVRLSDEEYPRAVARFVYHCCDVVLFVRDKENDRVQLCLAKRCIDPARNEWWVYGGSMNPGETLKETAIRHLKDDTGLEIDPVRLARLFGDAQQYLWTNGVGGYSMHVFVDTFAVQITPEELVRINLRSSEYYLEKGIRLFDLEGLRAVNAHPAMIKIYCQIAYIPA